MYYLSFIIDFFKSLSLSYLTVWYHISFISWSWALSFIVLCNMYRLYVSFILFFIKMVPRDAECAGSRGPIGGQADRHFPHSVIVSHTCHILRSSVQDIRLLAPYFSLEQTPHTHECNAFLINTKFFFFFEWKMHTNTNVYTLLIFQ